jgi:exodeoxyribonuclease-3
LISDKLGERPLNVSYGIGIEKHDREGRVTTAEFQKFIIVSTYFPYSGKGSMKRQDYRLEWEIEFFRFVKDLEMKKKKPVIFGGDLNLAHS